MKKMIFLALVLLVAGLECLGQHHKLYPPIRPLKEGGYSVKECADFLLPSDNESTYIVNCRKELLSIVNGFLREAGLSSHYNDGNPLDDRWILWIYYPERTSVEYREYPNGFWNSYQGVDGPVPYWDTRKFKGMVVVLHLEGYELDLQKAECSNFVRVPFKKAAQEKKSAQVVVNGNSSTIPNTGGNIIINITTTATTTSCCEKKQQQEAEEQPYFRSRPSVYQEDYDQSPLFSLRWSSGQCYEHSFQQHQQHYQQPHQQHSQQPHYQYQAQPHGTGPSPQSAPHGTGPGGRNTGGGHGTGPGSGGSNNGSGGGGRGH